MKTKIKFNMLSAELEDILQSELITLKGGNGGNSDTLDGGDLEEVVIIGDAPDDNDNDFPPPGDEFEDDNDDYEDDYGDDDDENWWDEDGSGGGDNGEDQTEEEEDETSDCKLTYANMPTGNGTDKQVLETCASSVLTKIDNMLGQSSTLDSMLNEFATLRTGQTSGNAFALAKMDLMTNGIDSDEFGNYIDSNYLSDDISMSYGSVQASVREGRPIVSHFVTGYEYDSAGNVESIITHAVMITGVTTDGKLSYWDPQTDSYNTSSDFGKFMDSKAIDMNQEIQVQCQ